MRRSQPQTRTLSNALRAALSRYNAIFADEIGSARDKRPLTSLQIVVLSTLTAHGAMSNRDLGSFAGIDRSTLSDMLIRLRKSRMVTKYKSQRDARLVLTEITREGQAHLKLVTGKAVAAERRFLAPLAPSHRASLLTFLDKLGAEE